MLIKQISENSPVKSLSRKEVASSKRGKFALHQDQFHGRIHKVRNIFELVNLCGANLPFDLLADSILENAITS